MSPVPSRHRSPGLVGRIRARFTVRETVELEELHEQPRPEQMKAWEESVALHTAAAFDSLKRNAWLNFFFRMALYATIVAGLLITLVYIRDRGDAMVGELLNASDIGADFSEDRLLALVVPVILMTLLVGAALVISIFLQSRGAQDFESGLDGISRLRREARDGVSRTRTMSYVLEEFLANVRRALRLQLWISQSLFIACILLFAAAVIQGLATGVNLLTAVLGAGSMVALVIARAAKVGPEIGTYLSNSTQLQLLVANTTRQVNLMEELLSKRIQTAKEDPTAAAQVTAGVDAISKLTHEAIAAIQTYTEPPLNVSAPEREDPVPPMPGQSPQNGAPPTAAPGPAPAADSPAPPGAVPPTP